MLEPFSSPKWKRYGTSTTSAADSFCARRFAARSDSIMLVLTISVGWRSTNKPPRLFKSSMGCGFPERSTTSATKKCTARSKLSGVTRGDNPR
jgi:hypothetical protein